MYTYVNLSRFSPEAFREPREFKKLAKAVSAKIKSECSGIRWKGSYATLGRFDVLDVVEANDPKQIEKAAMIIRAYGYSTTETLTATPWMEFLGFSFVFERKERARRQACRCMSRSSDGSRQLRSVWPSFGPRI